MADIGAALGRGRQANHRIQVGAIEVDLAAIVVDDLARLLDLWTRRD